MNEETFICDICGEEHAEAACTYWDDQSFCPTCLNTLTTLCRDCGERVYRDQAMSYGSEYILSLIHISEPTRQCCTSRMPSSA